MELSNTINWNVRNEFINDTGVPILYHVCIIGLQKIFFMPPPQIIEQSTIQQGMYKKHVTRHLSHGERKKGKG